MIIITKVKNNKKITNKKHVSNKKTTLISDLSGNLCPQKFFKNKNAQNVW